MSEKFQQRAAYLAEENRALKEKLNVRNDLIDTSDRPDLPPAELEKHKLMKTLDGNKKTLKSLLIIFTALLITVFSLLLWIIY